MKMNIWMFVGVLALSTACTPKIQTTTTQQQPADSVKVDDNRGKGGYLNPGAKTYFVSGKLMQTQSYCGGAAPSRDMLDRLNTPHPRPNQGLIVRTGTTNAVGGRVIAKVTTDLDGIFQLHLPPGTYCLALAEKEKKRADEFYNHTYQEVNGPCDDKWLATCDLTFTVTDQMVNDLGITVHQKCFVNSLSPCITYTGPMPP